MVFSKDKILIKSAYQLKGYNAYPPPHYRIWGLLQERVYNKTAATPSI